MPLVKDELQGEERRQEGGLVRFYAIEWGVALIVLATLVVNSTEADLGFVEAVIRAAWDVVPLVLFLVLADAVLKNIGPLTELPAAVRHLAVILLGAAVTELFEAFVPVADRDRGAWLPDYLEGAVYAALFWGACLGLRALIHRPDTPRMDPAPERPAGLLGLLEPPLRKDLLWMKAEGNYVDVYSSEGHQMVNYGFARAIEELGEQGIQVHRSYWVARTAAECLQSDGGRTVVVLKDGERLPVSRTFAREARQAIQELNADANQ